MTADTPTDEVSQYPVEINGQPLSKRSRKNGGTRNYSDATIPPSGTPTNTHMFYLFAGDKEGKTGAGGQ
jgi:hypothetical protein